MPSSKTPCVEGYVTMSAARSSLCACRFGAQICQVYVSPRVAGHGYNFHAGHGGAGGIGAVGGSRDQADAAIRLAARFVIFLNDQQAGVFALRAGIGLEGAAGQTGDFRTANLPVVGK